MTTTAGRHGDTESDEQLEPLELRRVVAVFCVTEIISWGVLIYAFPVMSASIADTEGWPTSWVMAAFTGGLVTSALAGLWIGRHIDRHGPRRTMTAGSCLAVLATLGIVSAPNLGWFVLAWLAAGLAMSATLYPPAFIALTHWAGRHRVRALTTVTLVAGFASTVFAPLTAWLLVAGGSWRVTYLVLAAFLVVTAPLHWWGLNRPWRAGGPPRTRPKPNQSTDPDEAQRAGPMRFRKRDLAALTLAMTLTGLAIFAGMVNLVPLLLEHGITTTQAAMTLGIGGVGQVAGRLLYGPALTRLPVRHRTTLVLGSVAATTAALALVEGPYTAIACCSFIAGCARGIYTLILATAVHDRWGTISYGARHGVLNAGVTTATSFAPWIGAALASTLGSHQAAFLALAATTTLAATASQAIPPPRSSTR